MTEPKFTGFSCLCKIQESTATGIADNLAVTASSLLKKIFLVPSSCCCCSFPALTELLQPSLSAVILVEFSFDSLQSQRGSSRDQTGCSVRLQCIKLFICFVAVNQFVEPLHRFGEGSETNNVGL